LDTFAAAGGGGREDATPPGGGGGWVVGGNLILRNPLNSGRKKELVPFGEKEIDAVQCCTQRGGVHVGGGGRKLGKTLGKDC